MNMRSSTLSWMVEANRYQPLGNNVLHFLHHNLRDNNPFHQCFQLPFPTKLLLHLHKYIYKHSIKELHCMQTIHMKCTRICIHPSIFQWKKMPTRTHWSLNSKKKFYNLIKITKLTSLLSTSSNVLLVVQCDFI
jgi:hypothetical protein